jgi:hypothetical protein
MVLVAYRAIQTQLRPQLHPRIDARLSIYFRRTALSRKPSPETELRTVRRELKKWKAGYDERVKDCTAFRMRAIKAEEESADWKRRFDLLLARSPPTSKGDGQ